MTPRAVLNLAGNFRENRMRIPGTALLRSKGAPWAGGSLLLVLTAAALFFSTGSSPTAPSAAPQAGADDITFGSKSAQVVLVEYSDFQCEVCAALLHDSRPPAGPARGFGSVRLQVLPPGVPSERHGLQRRRRMPPICRASSGRCTICCMRTKGNGRMLQILTLTSKGMLPTLASTHPSFAMTTKLLQRRSLSRNRSPMVIQPE